MKLFIARHGQASYEALSDFERPLTQKGREQTAQVLKDHEEEFRLIESLWCSDLTRAKETVQVFENALSLKADVKPFLSPDGDVAKVLREIRNCKADVLMIVSHQPLVGELVSLLVEGNVYQSHPFTTSEVVVLETDMVEAGLASLARNFIPL